MILGEDGRRKMVDGGWWMVDGYEEKGSILFKELVAVEGRAVRR